MVASFIPHLDPKTYQEFDESAVDRRITEANVFNPDPETLERILWGLVTPWNAQEIRDKHFEHGGWSVNGVFKENCKWPRKPYQKAKLNQPIWDKKKGKPRKYQAAWGYNRDNPLPLYFPSIPRYIAEKLASEYFLDVAKVNDQGNGWLYEESVPITFVEGEKKALSLLSQGELAIALPGIFMGTRKGEGADSWRHSIHHQIAEIVGNSPNREFRILFDYERERKKLVHLNKAIQHLGYALTECIKSVDNRIEPNIKVVLLPGKEKGVDDWLITKSESDRGIELRSLIGKGLSLYQFLCKKRRHEKRLLIQYDNLNCDSSYSNSEVINQPKLKPIESLDGVVGLVSEMSTGKSYQIAQAAARHPDESILVICHRVSLTKGICKSLNRVNLGGAAFAHYQDVQGSLSEVKRLVVTWDSLPRLVGKGQEIQPTEDELEMGGYQWTPQYSQQLPQFDRVVIDEFNQGLRHAMESTTCKDNRKKILDYFDNVVLRAKGVVVADAHLNRISLDYLKAIKPHDKPQLTLNNHKLPGRDVYYYKNQDDLAKQFLKAVKTRQRCVFVSSSRKDVMRYARMAKAKLNDDCLELQVFDGDREVISIHGKNSGSPTNQEFIANINEELETLEGTEHTYVLSFSPSLGTGVDIQKGGFKAIFATFKPCNLAATDCLQMLWRYRPTVPMHVWVGDTVIGGIRETNPVQIKSDLLKSSEANTFHCSYDSDGKLKPDHRLDTYAALIADKNWSINHLKDDLQVHLEKMGMNMIPVSNSGDNDAAKALRKEVSATIKDEGINAIVTEALIDDDDAKQLMEKQQQSHYLNPQEEAKLTKWRIHHDFGCDVDADLVKRDDEGKGARAIKRLDNLLAENQEGAKSPEHLIKKDWAELDNDAFLWDRGNRCVKRNFQALALGLGFLATFVLDGGLFCEFTPEIVELRDKAVARGDDVRRLLGKHIRADVNPKDLAKDLLKALGISVKSSRVRLSDQLIKQYSYLEDAPIEQGDRIRFYSLSEDEQQFLKGVLEYRVNKRLQKKKEQEERVVETEEVMSPSTPETSEVEVKVQQPQESTQVNILKPETHLLDPKTDEYHQQLEAIASWGEVSLDIETHGDSKHEGLHPWRGQIRLIQVSDGEKVFIADLGGRMEARASKQQALQGFFDVLKKAVESPDVEIIGHNVHFDLRFLDTQLGIENPRNLWDTMLGAQVFFGDCGSNGANRVMPYGLGYLAKEFAGISLDKKLQNSDWGSLLTPQQIDYAGKDPWATFHLYKALRRLYANPNEFGYGVLAQDGLLYIWKMESEVIRSGTEIERNGLPLDKEKTKTTIRQAKNLQLDLMKEWSKICPNIQPTQDEKLIKFLKANYGIALPSLKKEVVAAHLDNPLLKLRAEYLGLKTHINHAENLLRSTDIKGDDRVHTNYRTLTGTGRFSSGVKQFKELPNLQNTPAPGKAPQIVRDNNLIHVRDCVRVGEGKVLGIIDVSASHARISASSAQDKAAIKAFEDDSVDNHSKVAVYVSKALGHDWTWEYIAKARKDKLDPNRPQAQMCRDTAKNTYYGWLNGAGAKRIQAQIKANSGQVVSLDACEGAIKGCELLYPDLDQFKRKLTRKVNSDWVEINGKRFAINRMEKVGARLLLPMFQNPHNPDEWEASYSEILASTWSRMESIAMKRAILKCLDLAEANPQWELKLINYVHDELNFECSEVHAIEAIGACNDIIGDCFADILDNVCDGREKDVSKLIAKSWAEK